MIGAKLNIFRNEWLDVIFSGRNQLYGAYVLRKESASVVTKALFMGSALFVMGISMPLVWKYIQRNNDRMVVDVRTIDDPVTLGQTPPVALETPPPPAVAPPPARENQVRMPPPVVVEARQVRDSEPPTVDELKMANPGPKTVAGDPDADINIDMPVGDGPKGQQVTEASGEEDIFVAVEVPPAPAGGMEAFLQYIAKTYAYPTAAQDQGVSGRVILQFVVERDGSLTDIKIIRDLGFGTGAEAVRVLKKAKKWKPGIQNGQTVRVQFTLPIVLKLVQ